MATRGYSSSQKQIFGYRAEDRLETGHICFVIDEAVDNLKLGEAARDRPGPGAPRYNPRMMLKILVLGYCRGIRSSRKLAAECRENIAFIHLCRGAAPEYRTISRFRSDNLELIHSVFSDLVGLLVKAGIVHASHIIIDGTKIKANASKRRVLDRALVEAAKRQFDSWMSDSACMDELEMRLSSFGIRDDGIQRDLDDLRALVRKCEEAAKASEDEGLKRVSVTDKDSRFMHHGATGEIALSYNVQAAVDAESGIMLACDVTTDANDCSSLRPMVDEVEDSLHETVEAVDADCGYFESNEVRGLEALGKDVCVGEGKAKHASSRGDLERFVAGGDFVYDAERDSFGCPFGNEHVFSGFRQRDNGKKWRLYRSVRPCTGCPNRRKCFGRARNKFHQLERIADYPWLFEYRQRFLEPEYQRRLSHRSLIEHNFGHLKHNLGFRRFNLRGLCGVKIETFLAGCASVLRRLCNILKRTGASFNSLMRSHAPLGAGVA